MPKALTRRPWAALVLSAFALPGCPAADRAESGRQLPPPIEPEVATSPSEAAELGPPEGPVEPAEPDAPTAAVPHTGPYFAATESSAGIYMEPRFVRQLKIGYLRRGEKTPVRADPLVTKDCKGGWYEVVPHGYVCGDHGTMDLGHPEVRLATKPPEVSDVLPYLYARNVKNGTPLYHSLPSRDQMRAYEPYLVEEQRDQREPKGGQPGRTTNPAREPPAPPSRRPEPTAAATSETEKSLPLAKTVTFGLQRSPESASGLDDGVGERAALGEPEQSSGSELPWWQREDAKLHELSLEKLAAEQDQILARRMVKGFYVAVDRTFTWNNRTWYKTTKGLIAPRDRMSIATGSSFQGEHLNDGFRLPVGWTYGWRKSHQLFAMDQATQRLKPAGTVGRFEPLYLTGQRVEHQKKSFWETVEGFLIRESEVRVANLTSPPADLAEDERWIDVDLSTQTLVAYRGTKPVYATLLSSGKESPNKDKDHKTPLGEYRVREKHLTTTMDGDGTAAGDLPYSIEEVPYAIFFHRSFALHGAFWHENYGVRMSHGCVNLAPLDAKELFFFVDPPLGEGWHGSWASAEHPGTRIVIRE